VVDFVESCVENGELKLTIVATFDYKKDTCLEPYLPHINNGSPRSSFTQFRFHSHT